MPNLRLQFGHLDPCAQLWCDDGSRRYSCKTKNAVPLDGTQCGPSPQVIKLHVTVRFRICDCWPYVRLMLKMHFNAQLYSPPIYVVFFGSCDKVYHKQKIHFFVFTRSDCHMTI